MAAAKFTIIAAMDAARGMGKAGDLPWHIPADLKFFAATTKATKQAAAMNAVIMGRVTCESIPPKYWPLPERENFVITRNRDWHIEGARVHHSLNSALLAAQSCAETIFVVGGAQIYAEAIALETCEELLLTRIAGTFDCDTWFPEYETRFARCEEVQRGTHNGVSYTMERWLPKG